MTKSTWIEVVIKAHTSPVENDGTYVLKEKDGKKGKGYVEVLVKDVRQEVDRGSIFAGLKGNRVRLDSDDLLVLFYHDSLGDDIINYVLWQDIRAIKFVFINK